VKLAWRRETSLVLREPGARIQQEEREEARRQLPASS
jgi:hypothetical protein